MSKESAAKKRPTVTKGAPSPGTPPAIQPGQIAILGQSARSPCPATQAPFVQVLCWPLTNGAWSALSKAWTTIQTLRDSSTPLIKITKGSPSPPSWVHEAVPRLGAPFRDNPAEESTLAAWIARAQVSLSLSVVDPDASRAKGASLYATSIAECLSGYLEFLRFPAYEPCRLVVAGSLAAGERQQLDAALTEAQKRFGDMASMQRLSKLPLKTCTAGEVPLPVDFADLVCAATARFLNSPATPNRIFEAFRPKLVHVPRRIAALESRRRR